MNLDPKPAVCDICVEPLDDSQPWQRSFDGTGAHLACLETIPEEED